MKAWEEQQRIKNYASKIQNAKSQLKKGQGSSQKKLRVSLNDSQSSKSRTPSRNLDLTGGGNSLNDYFESEKEDLNKIPLYFLLKQYNLQQYANKLISRGYGYDIFKFNFLSQKELEVLMEDIKIMPGHRVKFISLLEYLGEQLQQINIQGYDDIFSLKSDVMQSPSSGNLNSINMRGSMKSQVSVKRMTSQGSVRNISNPNKTQTNFKQKQRPLSAKQGLVTKQFSQIKRKSQDFQDEELSMNQKSHSKQAKIFQPQQQPSSSQQQQQSYLSSTKNYSSNPNLASTKTPTSNERLPVHRLQQQQNQQQQQQQTKKAAFKQLNYIGADFFRDSDDMDDEFSNALEQILQRYQHVEKKWASQDIIDAQSPKVPEKQPQKTQPKVSLNSTQKVTQNPKQTKKNNFIEEETQPSTDERLRQKFQEYQKQIQNSKKAPTQVEEQKKPVLTQKQAQQKEAITDKNSAKIIEIPLKQIRQVEQQHQEVEKAEKQEATRKPENHDLRRTQKRVQDDICLVPRFDETVNKTVTEVRKNKLLQNIENQIVKQSLEKVKEINLDMEQIKNLYLSYDSGRLTSTLVNLDIEEMSYCLASALLKHIQFFQSNVSKNQTFHLNQSIQQQKSSNSQLLSSNPQLQKSINLFDQFQRNSQLFKKKQTQNNKTKGSRSSNEEGRFYKQSELIENSRMQPLEEITESKFEYQFKITSDHNEDSLSQSQIEGEFEENQNLNDTQEDEEQEEEDQVYQDQENSNEYYENQELDSAYYEQYLEYQQEVARQQRAMMNPNDQSSLSNQNDQSNLTNNPVSEPTFLLASSIEERAAKNPDKFQEEVDNFLHEDTSRKELRAYQQQFEEKRGLIQDILKESVLNYYQNQYKKFEEENGIPHYESVDLELQQEVCSDNEDEEERRQVQNSDDDDEYTQSLARRLEAEPDSQYIDYSSEEEQEQQHHPDHPEHSEYEEDEEYEDNPVNNTNLQFSVMSRFSTVDKTSKGKQQFLENKRLFDKTFSESSRDALLSQMPTKQVIQNYCKNILMTSKMEKEIPIVALVYIERLLVKSQQGIYGHNWRKILFTAMIMASKVWDDESFENENFAVAFPIFTTKQINDMERVFLDFIDYKLQVRTAEYAKYYFILRALAEKNKKSFPLRPLDLPTIIFLQNNGNKAAQILKEQYKQPFNKSF